MLCLILGFAVQGRDGDTGASPVKAVELVGESEHLTSQESLRDGTV